MFAWKARIVFFAALILIGIGGCTEYERKGLSPLPQNRPSSWENQPWGFQGFQN